MRQRGGGGGAAKDEPIGEGGVADLSAWNVYRSLEDYILEMWLANPPLTWKEIGERRHRAAMRRISAIRRRRLAEEDKGRDC